MAFTFAKTGYGNIVVGFGQNTEASPLGVCRSYLLSPQDSAVAAMRFPVRP